MSDLDLFNVLERPGGGSDLELFPALDPRRRFPPRGTSVFGTPDWYTYLCEAVSRAVWRGQITEAEANWRIDVWHRLMLAEMDRDGLWRRFKRTSGRRRPRQVAFPYIGQRCTGCGEPLGPFTGICAACHFRGWWW